MLMPMFAARLLASRAPRAGGASRRAPRAPNGQHPERRAPRASRSMDRALRGVARRRPFPRPAHALRRMRFVGKFAAGVGKSSQETEVLAGSTAQFGPDRAAPN